MPIYAFTCHACDHQFDRLQKLSDPDPAACPECGADAVKRQVTAPSFRLSGSGWYETDFKKEGDRKRNLSEKGGGEAKADAKPESTPAPKPAETQAGAKPDAKPAKVETPAAKPASGAA